MSTPEEALRSGGGVGAAGVKVMHGGERGELAVAEAMAAVVKQRKLTVAPLHGGAAALKEVGAFTRHLLGVSTQIRGELLQRMLALA